MFDGVGLVNSLGGFLEWRV